MQTALSRIVSVSARVSSIKRTSSLVMYTNGTIRCLLAVLILRCSISTTGNNMSVNIFETRELKEEEEIWTHLSDFLTFHLFLSHCVCVAMCMHRIRRIQMCRGKEYGLTFLCSNNLYTISLICNRSNLHNENGSEEWISVTFSRIGFETTRWWRREHQSLIEGIELVYICCIYSIISVIPRRMFALPMTATSFSLSLPPSSGFWNSIAINR